MEQTTILDLDSLMDESLDNIADVPDYVDPPAGNYVVKVHEAAIDKNPDATKPSRIRIVYATVSTKELSSETDMPVADGSLFSESFQATEQGLGFFKLRTKQIMNIPDVAGISLRDLLAAIKEVESFNGSISYTESKGKTPDAEGNLPAYKNLRMRISHEATA